MMKNIWKSNSIEITIYLLKSPELHNMFSMTAANAIDMPTKISWVRHE